MCYAIGWGVRGGERRNFYHAEKEGRLGFFHPDEGLLEFFRPDLQSFYGNKFCKPYMMGEK